MSLESKTVNKNSSKLEEKIENVPKKGHNMELLVLHLKANLINFYKAIELESPNLVENDYEKSSDGYSGSSS